MQQFELHQDQPIPNCYRKIRCMWSPTIRKWTVILFLFLFHFILSLALSLHLLSSNPSTALPLWGLISKRTYSQIPITTTKADELQLVRLLERNLYLELAYTFIIIKLNIVIPYPSWKTNRNLPAVKMQPADLFPIYQASANLDLSNAKSVFHNLLACIPAPCLYLLSYKTDLVSVTHVLVRFGRYSG